MLITENNKIIVTQNPLMNFIYTMISFLFTVLLFVFYKYSDGVMVYYKYIYFLGFLFFGFGTLFFIVRTIKNKDLIVVDEYGITDNTSAISLGFISWEDIVDIHVSNVVVKKHNEMFISVALSDEEKYLERISPIKRAVIRANMNMGFPAVNITLKSCGISNEEFCEKLLEYKQNIKK